MMHKRKHFSGRHSEVVVGDVWKEVSFPSSIWIPSNLGSLMELNTLHCYLAQKERSPDPKVATTTMWDQRPTP